jgi:hypothetical protein
MFSQASAAVTSIVARTRMEKIWKIKSGKRSSI